MGTAGTDWEGRRYTDPRRISAEHQTMEGMCDAGRRTGERSCRSRPPRSESAFERKERGGRGTADDRGFSGEDLKLSRGASSRPRPPPPPPAREGPSSVTDRGLSPPERPGPAPGRRGGSRRDPRKRNEPHADPRPAT
ncbi:hypothetical protein SKAU_G00311180 [Synaphobranchus kaupii]|uniref:Uncharacterized protein n=1 Tax=Synaphobranchus kaupii TaxID=118154 RepID=A0A9Q1ERN6_SYNKA|nr:hypothetical protein SKAU_G00311180 [Synaphobranchus kaupii]